MIKQFIKKFYILFIDNLIYKNLMQIEIEFLSNQATTRENETCLWKLVNKPLKLYFGSKCQRNQQAKKTSCII